MPFSVRLDPDTEALIDRVARNNGQTRAWVVRKAAGQFAAQGEDADTLSDRMKPHLGIFRCGSQRPLSEDTGTQFSELVRAKACIASTAGGD